MQTTKFNVSTDTSKRTCNGIVFDSILEMRYYRDVILPKVESGEILDCQLQKEYVLQPKFERHGKNIQPIKYVADFWVKYADGSEQVIDTKGMPDTAALLKRKMFWHVYPDLDYIWMCYVKKFGGWLEYEDAKKQRSLEKKNRKEMGND